MFGWSCYDVVISIDDGLEIKKLYDQVAGEVERVKNKLPELRKTLENYGDKKPAAVAADAMDVLATVNDCTRARKCQLVKYNDTKKGAFENLGDKQPACCPGQTGHHLIPDVAATNSSCSNYKEGEAPTVCVEGTTHGHGSHQRIHKALKESLDNALSGSSNTLSLDDYIDAAASSHAKAFPAVVL